MTVISKIQRKSAFGATRACTDSSLIRDDAVMGSFFFRRDYSSAKINVHRWSAFSSCINLFTTGSCTSPLNKASPSIRALVRGTFVGARHITTRDELPVGFRKSSSARLFNGAALQAFQAVFGSSQLCSLRRMGDESRLEEVCNDRGNVHITELWRLICCRSTCLAGHYAHVSLNCSLELDEYPHSIETVCCMCLLEEHRLAMWSCNQTC